MDIVCPDCAAVYEIDETTVTESGRKVRCAACSTVWRVFPPGYDPVTGELLPEAAAVTAEILASPEQPAAEPDGMISAETAVETSEAVSASANGPAELPETTVPPVPAEAPPRRAKWKKDKTSKSSGSKVRSWLLTWPAGAVAATLVILGVGLHQRARVVQYLPQTARLYAIVGVPVNLRGITINNVASRMIDDNGVSVLVIDGDIANATDQSIRLPRLRFAVLGKDRQEIYSWSAQTDQANLKPGEKINFRRRLAAPPADGQDVSVRFVTTSDSTSGLK
jgi:predicted Zn finger-like uncharacterized protein